MSRAGSIWKRDFFLLWQGSVVSALGSQAYSIALMLWAKQATESGTVVGLMLFAGGISSLLMPFGGVLADRYSRRLLLVWLDCLTGLSVLALPVLFLAFPADSALLIPAVLVLNGVRGACMALFHPVAAAMVPDLVEDAGLNRANSALQSAFRVTSLFGQSLGGLAFRVLGAPLLMFVDGISFLLSAASEWFIREPPREPRPAHARGSVMSDLQDGLRFTGRVPGFRIYLVEASTVNFCMATIPVGLPFLVEDVYHVSVDWYGYLLAAMGGGAIAGSMLAARFPEPGPVRGSIHLASLVVMSGVMLPLSLMSTPWGALAVLVPAWIGVGFHQVVLSTLVQKRTPKALRGRVAGLLATIRFGLTPLGMAVFGVLIDVLDGQVVPLLFGTGVAALAIITWAVLHRDYRWFFLGDETEIAAE
jgi:DHA3 family macrolide efflux protein-like MFS transporter